MSYTSMTDNYRNYQLLINCKLVLKTFIDNIILENYRKYFVKIVIYILKVLKLLSYE